MKTSKTVVKPARLTNDMRQSFITAVMADVPTVDYETRIRDAVNKAHAAALPLAIKKLLADPALAPFVRVENETLHQEKGRYHSKSISFMLPAGGDRWLRNVVDEAAGDLLNEWRAHDEQRVDLQRKLAAVASSCATPTALAEAFPEFAQYLPQTAAEGTRNLPALANVVTDFVKAGWPKGKKGAGQ